MFKTFFEMLKYEVKINMKKTLYNIEKIEIYSEEYKEYEQSEKTMLRIEQTSNIKPDEWYNEFLNKEGLEESFNDEKEGDKRIDIYHIINNHLTPFNEQMHEAQIIMDPFYKKYDNLPLQERNNKLMSFNEFVEAEEQHSRAYKNYYHNIPPGVTEEEFNHYHQLIRGKVSCNLEIVFNYNTLEKNAKFLKFLIAQHNNLKKKRAYKQLCIPYCKETIQTREKQFKLCEQAIKKGYLITNQLDDLNYNIGDCHYCILKEKEKKHPKNISDLYFEDFSCTDEQIFNLIRKNAKWHDIDRDLTIYQEREKGKYLQEIADNFGVKFNSISMVVKKVQSAINYYKGKLFEDFIYKRLNQSNFFKNVVKEAGKGEPDILTYTKDDKELYIYSLKNIKIDRIPYWLITKEELRPEIERALLQTLDYKVQLILLVFDNHNDKVKQFKIDYNNPINIDISK